MAAGQLIDYVRVRLQRGASEERIQSALLQAGWEMKDIQKAIRRVKSLPPLKGPTAAVAVEGYAGFWRRLAAYLIDQVAVLLVGLVIGMVFIALTDNLILLLLYYQMGAVLLFLLSLLYFALMESSSRQATLGKMLAGIQVVTEPQGDRLSFFRAAIRSLGKIASTIPLFAGYVMAGFTERRQALHDMVAGSTVIRRGRPYLLRTALIGIPCLAIVFGGGIAYVYYVKIPAWTQGFMESVAALGPPSENAGAGVASMQARVVEKPKRPQRMSEADYDRLLASRAVGFESGPRTPEGPVAFKISNFWDHGDNPSVWIEIRTSPLPNFNLPGAKLAKMEIHHVWDEDKRDIYDQDSGFETPFFQGVAFSEREEPYPHLAAVRDVHLVTGVKEQDIRMVEGRFLLRLPVNVEVLTLDASDTNKVADGSGVKVSLSGASRGKISLKYEGSFNRYVSTLAYNEAGDQIESSMYSWSTDDKTNVTNFEYAYEGTVRKVEVAVASRMVERDFPFVIQRE